MKRNPVDGSPSELRAALAEIAASRLWRERQTVEFPEPGSRVATAIGATSLIDFSSNDYLGLARHPDVAAQMAACAHRSGAGSGASHLITGHGLEHARLEEELAAFTGRERALLFSTGYMANLAVLTSLAARTELVLLDRLDHASLIDAGLLSGARFKRYAHADSAAAESALAGNSNTATVLATDGVFSMDGDVAPLPALARACITHGVWLVVDDAHGLGVLGSNGGGSVDHFGLDSQAVPVLIGTLGKAFGSFGAFVAGSAELIELLINKARTYIYTTALPQPVAAASRKALQLVQRESWRRERVLALAARFRAAAAQLDIPLANSSHPITPIQPLLLGSSEAAVRAQHELRAAGFLVVAIRPPTVPEGSARLRVTLSAAHTESQVDALVEALSHTCARHTLVCS